MKLKYMRQNLEDTYGLLGLQDKILEIMVYIDQFCELSGIDYCLMGGSALGAKRHGGFIPWDDDLDIFMTPENYERFRKEFEKRGDKEKYYLQEWGLTDGMVTIAKVRLNGTSYIEEAVDDWNIHHGIYVDIFILHSCPNNKFLQLWQCLWAKYAITKGLALREKNRHSGFRGFIIKIAKCFPNRFLIKYALSEVYRYRDKKTNYYCNFLGKAFFKKGIYRRELFDKTVYIQFETVKLKVPKRLNEFLTERFGDYMKLPSQKRIKYEQHAKNWNLEQQIIKSTDYKDEINLI